jgi:transcription-repair coupling factor (superfamily II helicase)
MTSLLFDSDICKADTSSVAKIGVLASALPYLAQQIVESQPGFNLLITKDMQQAYSISSAMSFFCSDEKFSPMVFPDWETLPYDTFSPHEDIISLRLKALNDLPQKEAGCLIVPISTLLQRLAPRNYIKANSLSVAVGDKFDVAGHRAALESVGYRNVETVYEHSEYAIRGSIMDIFPMGSEVPIRIELFDDEIDSLRFFDPETQRSQETTDSFNLLPAFEFPWDPAARLSFRNKWLDCFPESSFSSPVLRDIKDGIKPHGIEYYAPLFFDEMATLFDYLPSNTRIIFPEDIEPGIETVWKEVFERYEDRRHDIQRPILSPASLYLKVDECFGQLKNWPRIQWSDTQSNPSAQELAHVIDCSLLPDVSIDERSDAPLVNLNKTVTAHSGKAIVVAETAGRREVLLDLFKTHKLGAPAPLSWQAFISSPEPFAIAVGAVDKGFIDAKNALLVITESELFGQKVKQTRRQKKTVDQAENMVRSLTELRVGAPVVHIDHGVGRYRGLETITIDGLSDEFLMLEYANKAKLYVPISSLNLISRYSGTEESLAPLHKLGTEKWSVAKQKALEKIRDTAAELLEVYAQREAKKGFKNEHPGQAYRAFCAGFPFEETVDQANAINAVVQDMTRAQPMDRLVCGDVGFGKTEVAMRAAFIATYSGKQVAVLVPTTLLAQQHYESFQDRFADTAVKVEVLSRFNSPKEQASALKSLTEGKVDIIIGTHKLIQDDVKFKDLGLLIIDEEHRFGVQQKERLKKYRAEVDILALTATPIPRTLNMAMGGVRDLSIIATPPAKRLSVKTFVREKQDALIRESVLREVLRGGQVYYLFNDVKNIEKEVGFLQNLIPEARVGFAHGQMRERELEQAMSDFYHQRFNVLICSTIIETGIDIPNANTILIDRADKFGLAQLHQLRGRVGRSHHQAYAYLLTPVEKRLTKDAEKRLEAISAAQDLGAGFMLATHDLEIRGAGELLGEEQSGQIQTIGFSLYMELLEQAVTSLQEGKVLSIEQSMHGTEVNLRIPALIPEDYLPDVHSRLVLYKRISNAKTKDQLKDIQIEMIDRFGLLTNQIKNLLKQTELKLLAESIGIIKIDAGATSGKIEFGGNTKVDPLAIVQLVQKSPHLYRLEGANKLKFELKATTPDEKIEEISGLIKLLQKAA